MNIAVRLPPIRMPRSDGNIVGCWLQVHCELRCYWSPSGNAVAHPHQAPTSRSAGLTTLCNRRLMPTLHLDIWLSAIFNELANVTRSAS